MTTASEESRDSLVGSLLADKYQIERLLGEGGMGQVYLATQTIMDRRVAIKVLRGRLCADENMAARFVHEARMASRISHPNVVTIHDFGYTDDHTAYLVMEFVEGEVLAHAIARQRPMPWSRTISIINQMAAALGEAHRLGIVHRDIKPENAVLNSNGGRSDFVKVLDFGLAKLREAESQKLTLEGQFMGTPEYMSPEQIQGDEITPATDMYALGVVFYEMLTGTVPFKGATVTSTIMKHLTQLPVPPRDLSLELDIPQSVETVLLKCMEKEAEDRYGSMSELITALHVATDGLEAPPEDIPGNNVDVPPKEGSPSWIAWATSPTIDPSAGIPTEQMRERGGKAILKSGFARSLLTGTLVAFFILAVFYVMGPGALGGESGGDSANTSSTQGVVMGEVVPKPLVPAKVPSLKLGPPRGFHLGRIAEPAKN